MEHLKTTLLIVGGGTGGCAAALAAARSGIRTIVVEESDWIGGQFTSQAVPPDEHGWIERFGSTASYRRFRETIRAHYRTYYPLKPGPRDHRFLNPGNGWVSPLCHEPKVALNVLRSLLSPFETAGDLSLVTNHHPIACRHEGSDQLYSIIFRCSETGNELTIEANLFVDATENGDLLSLAQVEHVTGAESKDDTDEPDAKSTAQPDNVQAFSVCFAMDYSPKASHIGNAPVNYEYWRAYIPKLIPPWPGPWLSLQGINPRTMRPHPYYFNPNSEPLGPFGGLWGFRRILDRKLFLQGSFMSDICLVNWPMIDHVNTHLLTDDINARAASVSNAREQSLSMFYWLQTEAPRADGGTGWPGLRLRGDITGTTDGLAKMPYIREARRIRAEFTIRQQHIAESCRPNDTVGEEFPDSVGIGYYRIDLHPTSGGDNYLDVGCLPFQIPLGALIPVRFENLLPAAKNIGTTHITNGCYRVHPVEWNIGEAVGELSVYCLENNLKPREVYRDARQRQRFQRKLKNAGFELKWPKGISSADGDPHLHASHRYY